MSLNLGGGIPPPMDTGDDFFSDSGRNISPILSTNTLTVGNLSGNNSTRSRSNTFDNCKKEPITKNIPLFYDNNSLPSFKVIIKKKIYPNTCLHYTQIIIIII